MNDEKDWEIIGGEQGNGMILWKASVLTQAIYDYARLYFDKI